MKEQVLEIILQSFSDSPLGRVHKAAYLANSRGIRGKSMRILGSYGLLYVLEGRGRFEDQTGTIRNVRQGDLILLFPDVAHRYGPVGRAPLPAGRHGGRPHDTWNEFYILFEGPVFDLWRRGGLLDPANPVHHLQPMGHWLKRLQGAVTDVPQTAHGPHPLAAVCRLQQVLADIFVHLAEGRMGAGDREWLGRACELLEQPAPGEQMDWDELAGRLFMSYENFRKKFARLAGVPPSRYRMRRIMERASELMNQTPMTLRQIAEQCGFCNEFHFSRRFKQIVGLSPKEFRRQSPR